MSNLCECSHDRVLPFAAGITLCFIHGQTLWNRLINGYKELVAKVQEAMQMIRQETGGLTQVADKADQIRELARSLGINDISENLAYQGIFHIDTLARIEISDDELIELGLTTIAHRATFKLWKAQVTKVSSNSATGIVEVCNQFMILKACLSNAKPADLKWIVEMIDKAIELNSIDFAVLENKLTQDLQTTITGERTVVADFLADATDNSAITVPLLKRMMKFVPLMKSMQNPEAVLNVLSELLRTKEVPRTQENAVLSKMLRCIVYTPSFQDLEKVIDEVQELMRRAGIPLDTWKLLKNTFLFSPEDMPEGKSELLDFSGELMTKVAEYKQRRLGKKDLYQVIEALVEDEVFTEALKEFTTPILRRVSSRLKLDDDVRNTLNEMIIKIVRRVTLFILLGPEDENATMKLKEAIAKAADEILQAAQQQFKQMFMVIVVPKLEDLGLPAKIFTIADRVYTQLTVGDAEMTLQEAFSMFDLDTQCLQQLEHAGIFKLSDVMRVINHPATGKDRNILKLVEKSLPPAVLTMLKHRSVILEILKQKDSKQKDSNKTGEEELLKGKLKQAFAELLRAELDKINHKLKLSRELLQIVPGVCSAVYGVLEDAAGRDEANVGEIVGNILLQVV